MALRINGLDVVSDTYVLSNVANTDVTTQTTINSAIINQNNILRIYDSAGTEIRTLFCANATAQG